jgi:hypothetical protein
MRLLHVVFTRTAFPITEYQAEYIMPFIGTLGKEIYFRKRQRNEEEKRQFRHPS